MGENKVWQKEENKNNSNNRNHIHIVGIRPRSDPKQ